MLKLYYLLFKILLALPIFGILNSTLLNNFAKTQKIINDSLYLMISLICSVVLVCFTEYGRYDFYLFTMSRNVPLAFSANSFNLMFGIFLSLLILSFNTVFQSSFSRLNLDEKYKLYNIPVATLYFLCILLSFSHSILLTLFIYASIIIASYFIITNPDLREFRIRYSVIFSASLIGVIIFMCMLGFYYKYTGNTFFTLQNTNKLNNISAYWLVFVFIILIASNFCAPFYLIFQEKFYYEDLLPVFTIFFIPFVFCNTFLFIKTAYFVFYTSIHNVDIYFFYTNFLVILLFFVACGFLIRHIKNNIKFPLLLGVSCFMIFLSQMLFINSNSELVNIFSSFLLLMLCISLAVLTYSGVLFILLKTGITDTNILYENSKKELNFYTFCLLLPILVLLISFFDLGLYNSKPIYFINLAEIFILFIVLIVHIFMLISKKVQNNPRIKLNITKKEKLKFFISQIGLLIIILFFFVLRNQVAKFILYYK